MTFYFYNVRTINLKVILSMWVGTLYSITVAALIESGETILFEYNEGAKEFLLRKLLFDELKVSF